MRVGRPRLLGLVFLALVAAGTAWLLAAGASGVAIATVLAVTVAVLTFAAQLFGVSWAPPDSVKLAAEAYKLAGAVAARETGEQNLFLADSAEGKPADISFVSPEQRSWRAELELVIWRSASDEQSGSLNEILGFYAGADAHAGIGNGRLVILGDAGAGKTVLANQLLLDLTASLVTTGQPPKVRQRVPVRLSLPAFDPGVDDGQIDSNVVAARLDAWIASQLREAYGLSERVAIGLVAAGWILPVLDGLDEMDSDEGNPVRAAAAVSALNSSATGGVRPIVVTCRNDRYKQLAALPARVGQKRVVQDATVVEVEPLTCEQVQAYLIRRFPDPVNRAQAQPRWKPILDQVQAGGPLAAALGSPLRLYMALTTYYQPNATPKDLCKLTTEAIDTLLFAGFIPAVASQHEKPGGGYYDDVDVTHWLHTLARHLKRQQEEGGSGSDIDLSKLWTAADKSILRRWNGIIQLLFTGLPLLVAGSLYVRASGHLIAPNIGGRVSVFGLACIVVLAVGRARSSEVRLMRFDLSQLRAPAGRRAVATGFAVGAVVGAVSGLIFLIYGRWGSFLGLAGKIEDVLGSAIAVGLVAGVAWHGGVSGAPKAISRPRELVVQGLAHDLAIPLVVGVAGAIAYAIGASLVVGLTGELTDRLTAPGTGPVFGFCIGFAIGTFFVTDSPWPRYFIATRALSRRQELPTRPAVFLDWAYDAGLLRLAGVAVQFRHRDLQKHLIASDASPSQTVGV